MTTTAVDTAARVGVPPAVTRAGRHAGFAGLRHLRRVVWGTTCAALAALAIASWPQLYGGSTTVTIVSGQSMEPTYSSGDLLVTREGIYEEKDVVVYAVPTGESGAGQRVVHRIVGGSGTTGWRTQGDANAALDIWRPHDSDVVGGVVLHIPKLGLALMQLRNPMTWALCGGVYIGYLLWPKDEDQAEASGPERHT